MTMNQCDDPRHPDLFYDTYGLDNPDHCPLCDVVDTALAVSARQQSRIAELEAQIETLESTPDGPRWTGDTD